MKNDNVKILVVDDDFDYRFIIKNLLSKDPRKRYVIEESENGRNGLEKLKKVSYDLIILDYQLGDMDGITFLREFKKLNIKTPIIMLTGKGYESIVKSALDLGVVDYIMKIPEHLNLLPNIVDKNVEIYLLKKKIENIESKIKEPLKKEVIKKHSKLIKILEEEKKELTNKIKRLEYLVEEMDEIHFTLNKNGEFTSINKAAEIKTGFNREDWILEKSYLTISAPRTKERAIKNFNSLINGEIEEDEYELDIFDKDGNIINLYIHDSPIFDENNKILGVKGIAIDITQRKKWEEKYREIVEGVDEGIYECDKNGKLIYINKPGAQILGYNDPIDIIGKDVAKTFWVYPKERNISIKLVVEKGIVRDYEIELYKQDRSIITISDTYTKLTDLEGNFIGIRGFFWDVTEEKKLQRKYGEIVDGVQEAIFECKKDGKITFINEPGAQILGFKDTKEIIGKSIDKYFYVHEKDKLMFKKFLKGEFKDPYVHEVEIYKKYKTIITIKCIGTKLIDYKGNFIGLRGFFIDITKEKESEKRYESLFKNVQAFIYVHDLNGNFVNVNPIAQELTGYTNEKILKMNISNILDQKSLNKATDMILKKKLVYAKRYLIELNKNRYLPKNRRETIMKKLIKEIFPDEEYLHIIKEVETSKEEFEQEPYEMVIIKNDGKELPIEVLSTPIIELGGKKVIQGVATDVSKRKILSDLSKKITSPLDYGSIEFSNYLKYCLNEIMKLISKIGTNIFVYEKKDNKLFNIASKGLSKQVVKKLQSLDLNKKNNGLATKTFLNKHFYQIKNWEEFKREPSLKYILKEAENDGEKGLLSYPLMIGDEAIGVFQAVAYFNDYFKDEDVDLFNSVANQLATGIKRYQLQNEVKEHEQFLESALDYSTEAIIAVKRIERQNKETKGEIIILNIGVEKITGYTRDYVKESDVRKFYHKGEAEKIMRMLRKSPDKKVIEYETFIIGKGKKDIPVRLSASIIYDQGDNEWGSIGVYKDLREEIKMREMEQFFKSALEHSAEAIIIVKIIKNHYKKGKLKGKSKGEISIFNEGASNITNHKINDILGKDVRKYYPNGVAEEIMTKLKESNDGSISNHVTDIIGKKKEKIPIRLGVSIIYNHKKILFVLPLNIKQNIRKGKIHKKIRRRFEDNGYVISADVMMLKNDEKLWIIKDGLKRYQIEETDTELKVYLERVWGTIGVFQDLRKEIEKKALEQKLINSEKLASIGMLASGVAHEVINPLIPVIDLTGRISGLKNIGTIKKYANDAWKLSKHIEQIVNDLRAHARTECVKEKVVKDLRSEQIHDLIDGTTKIFQLTHKSFQDKKIKIKRDYKSKSILTINSGDLWQVFSNILINAAEAIPITKKGIITIRTFDKNDHFVLTVTDNGIGISKKNMQRLSDPFFTTKPDGTGLGLYTVKKILPNYNGTITVNSKKGISTKVTVKISGKPEKEGEIDG